MSLAERVRVVREETLADDWGVLKKTTVAFRRASGEWQEMPRETYDRGNGVGVLLYDRARRTVVLARQFRYPAFVNGHPDLLIEVPAGKLDDASPAERIRAEAEEETGFRVREPREVFDAFMSPGSVTERLHLFVAAYEPGDRVAEGGGLRAEGEDIDVLEVPFEEAMAMVADGRIRDAKTILLLQHAALAIFAPKEAP
jgi:nudix-type nucleoside diphosphatase (YffH/AdpP family)